MLRNERKENLIRKYHFYFDYFLIFLEQNRFNKYLKDMFFDILKKKRKRKEIFLNLFFRAYLLKLLKMIWMIVEMNLVVSY